MGECKLFFKELFSGAGLPYSWRENFPKSRKRFGEFKVRVVSSYMKSSRSFLNENFLHLSHSYHSILVLAKKKSYH